MVVHKSVQVISADGARLVTKEGSARERKGDVWCSFVSVQCSRCGPCLSFLILSKGLHVEWSTEQKRHCLELFNLKWKWPC